MHSMFDTHQFSINWTHYDPYQGVNRKYKAYNSIACSLF